MIKFTKNDNYYWATRNDEVVAMINIHYNFFDRSNFYTVGDKQFNKLNDAKKYVRENF